MIPRTDQSIINERTTPVDQRWYAFFRDLMNGRLEGDAVRLPLRRTIATSADTGIAGDVCFDADYVYFCVDTDTWRRVSLGGAF